MYTIGLLAEGGNADRYGWLVWVAIAIFFIMVILGWWVAQKGWLKDEEEPVHEAHEHEDEPAPVQAVVAAPTSTKSDDLTIIEGIGPKVSQLLQSIGISTFQQLTDADLGKLREALDGAGYQYMEPAGWVEQAALAAQGDTEGLQKLQDELKGGRRVD